MLFSECRHRALTSSRLHDLSLTLLCCFTTLGLAEGNQHSKSVRNQQESRQPDEAGSSHHSVITANARYLARPIFKKKNHSFLRLSRCSSGMLLHSGKHQRMHGVLVKGRQFKQYPAHI